MQNNVTFRSERINDNARSDTVNRSLQFTRPKSWGEFQSSLKTFQRIQRPKTSTKLGETKKNIENCPILNGNPVEEKSTGNGTGTHDVTYRSKPSSASEYGKATRSRPFSEIIAPPSFIKFNAANSLTLPKLRSDAGLTDSDARTFHESLIAQTTDVASLEFESALENSSTLSSNTETLFDPKTSAISDERISSCGNDILNAQQPQGTEQDLFLASNSDNLLSKQKHYREDETTNENENINELDLSDKQPENFINTSSVEKKDSDCSISILEVLAGNQEVLEVKTDSESSSVIDTGFNSFGEAANSLVSVDAADSSTDQEDSIMKSGVKTGFSAQTRKVIPTPLRGCYLNRYDLRSEQRNSMDSSLLSKSSNSSISGTLSEDESVSSFLPPKIFVNNSDGLRSLVNKQRGDSSPAMYTASAQFKFGNVKAQDNEKKKALSHFDRHSNESGSEKSCRSTPRREKRKTSKNWKDDLDAPTVNNTSGQVTKSVRSHGTWPRQANHSKRKRSQAEADELLRKFRETSEIYRAKFREIYAETRRKIEETMFGLRVAVAKSGYSAKYYSMSKLQLVSSDESKR